ncbi:MAG: rRNA (pseudouridine1915-N3)-methyltransferase [Candidatus Woesearchaeota archaeon]|nr:rRNA (pseudouridine1915-N3)-methyltransferase [Candidatus Woesearchaeota archaeon]MDN5327813.1 rRNA (pseudouridine1915-N3)-methyltransferase [Candidatus Woesearchaeota archaeon]
MKYVLAYVGKIKQPFRVLFDEYKKRLSIEELCFDSRDKLNKFLENKQYVLLDEKGQEFDSLSFADFIANLNEKAIFVIGDENGFDEKIKENAKLKIALSKMTLPHDLAKIILLEQVYRAESIIKNKKYHR